MSLLDPIPDFTITLGQKYRVTILTRLNDFKSSFHQSMWKDEVYEYCYDYSSSTHWFHKPVIEKAIQEIPIEKFMCAQPYREIRNVLRRLTRPRFEWCAKLVPGQSQISLRMGHSVELVMKVKDMGERHWKTYMQIIISPIHPEPF